ncbi:hypothetical protein AeNC1_013463, partial [Aphanomyces euteiches]
SQLVKPEATPQYKRFESRGLIASAIQAQAEDDDQTPYCFRCNDSTNGGENSPMELIAPCSCQSYVHRKCFDHYRITSVEFSVIYYCPTCRDKYEIEEVPATSPEEYKKQLLKARLGRIFIVLLVIALGSMVIALIDAGTPKFFNLHWNALDGKIYEWVGLTSVPRFVIYFLLSLAMTAIITCLFFLTRWCLLNVSCASCCNNCCSTTGSTNVSCCPYTPYYGIDCCVPYNTCYCCDCNGCSFGGDFGEYALVSVIVIVVCAIVAGLVMIFVAIVGVLAGAANLNSAKTGRELEVQKNRVRNLRAPTTV